MEDYRRITEYLSCHNIDSEFSCIGIDKNAIVLQSIFNNAEESIKIFSEALDSQVVLNENFLNALCTYIKSGKKLEIILERIPQVKSQALKRVLEASKESAYDVHCKLAEYDFIESLKRLCKGNIYYFVVSDNRSYKVQIEKKYFKAICNFNDQPIANELTYVFDDFFVNLNRKCL